MIVESDPDVLAAWTLHMNVGKFVQEQIESLPSERSRAIFWRTMLQSVQRNLPSDPMPADNKTKPSSGQSSYDEAMSLISEIEERADCICDAGRDFADSVWDKTESIMESVERSHSATDGQLTALENMLEGLQRWFHD